MTKADQRWRAINGLRYPLFGVWALSFVAWILTEFVFGWELGSRILEAVGTVLVAGMFAIMGWLRGYMRGQLFQNEIVAEMFPTRGLYRDAAS